MNYTGYNLPNVKIANRSSILQILTEKGPMARKDIARELGLTAAAVTQICSEMMNLGILKEIGELSEEKRAGRKKILIGIDYTFAYVLGISIEISITTISLADLKGQCIRKQQIATDADIAPEKFLIECLQIGKELIRELKLTRDRILGLGVSVPGIVSREDGVSIHAYRIWDTPVEIRRILELETSLPILVENNVKAYAEAELTFGAGREQENLIFLKWGPGVGSAIVINNKIYHNRHNASSEFGHVVIRRHGGKLCRCGRYGCLETEVSTHAIRDAVRSRLSAETMPLLWKYLDGDSSRLHTGNIREWAEIPDPGMQEVFREILVKLCDALSDAATILTPDHIIYYGDIFQLSYFAENFETVYRHSAGVGYEEGILVESQLKDKISYIGATAIVCNEKLLRKNDG